ncbi:MULTISPECIES: monovalent cation/H(+) antiporter subunit G [Halobacterium]|uniref:monovalent cation/H(+) antiporter subunit G n=1 Tax=Halobacterium TaxID=2239 RepID=UPI00073EB535|nr:monovalent cation/H(+) antiporter subunit G [Halobacterium sp. CBA1132]MCG1002519.1 monovalent cation/H(+) antiporter subunit G [Halobacterium noricense]
MTPRELAVLVLVAGGAFFAFVAAVGLLRLPDIYTRTHGASKSDTLGAGLALAAVAVTFGFDLSTAKAALLVLFMFITNPTAAHAIARAAADQGIEPWTTDEGDSE